MNQEQVMGLIRQVLPIVGTLATAAGLGSPEQIGDLTEKVLAAAGPVLVLGSMAWSMKSKTDKAIVQRAIALPEVKRIETSPTPEGVKLAESVPDDNVVSVGTEGGR